MTLSHLYLLSAGDDNTKNKVIGAIKPKPLFRPVFQVAATREGSDIHILNEPLEGSAVFLVETGETCLSLNTQSILYAIQPSVGTCL
jgi:hypothetical protein